MALDPPGAWVKRLKQNAQSDSIDAGAKELADFYGDLADKVQGIGGAPGIFTFNRAMFASQLLALGFSPTPSAPAWANIVSTAWLNAINVSAVTPATVSNPAWIVSGVDVQTAPTGAATIVTAPLAKATLQAKLIASSSAFGSDSDDGIAKFAEAFRDATLQFQFLTIGLTLAGGSPVPLPIPTGVQ